MIYWASQVCSNHQKSLSCSRPVPFFTAVLAEIKSSSVAAILQAHWNAHLSDVLELCTLISECFPQITVCAYSEVSLSLPNAIWALFICVCCGGFNCGIHVGSLVRGVAFASCNGDAKAPGLSHFIPPWVSIACAWGSIACWGRRSSAPVGQWVRTQPDWGDRNRNSELWVVLSLFVNYGLSVRLVFYFQSSFLWNRPWLKLNCKGFSCKSCKIPTCGHKPNFTWVHLKSHFAPHHSKLSGLH